VERFVEVNDFWDISDTVPWETWGEEHPTVIVSKTIVPKKQRALPKVIITKT
jgi:hypothetical protein